MSTPVRSSAASLRVFLEGIIDYAGLFAPASLDMRSSVTNYARYLNHPQRWALGRFVLPVARLEEFLNAREVNVRESTASEPWHLSGILSDSIAAELAAVDAFNRKALGSGIDGSRRDAAVIDSLEVRVSKPEEIELVRKLQPPGTTVFFEIAPEKARELLPMVSRVGGCAKLRTGGVVAEAFPAIEAIADFLARCSEMGVPFKATAGLHHPLRGMRPLTYEADSPEGTMHGFLNVFTAAAIAWSARQSGGSAPRDVLATCLADPERAHWQFGEDALTWSGDPRPVRIELDALRSLRSKFALGFGSCSFEEPIQEMRELDLL
jgi:hypothetical protein